MKIAFYQMRPFDEQAYIEQFSREFGIDYVTIPGAPCPENLDKAAGCDAVSQNPCEILPEYVEAWARMGVKYLLCRSIGYDHWKYCSMPVLSAVFSQEKVYFDH